MLSKRFYGAALMAAIVIPVGLQGCSSDSPLCCSEFKAGADVDVKIGGDAKAQVAVQAIADFSGIAAAAVDDLTTACRSMAQDLDADSAAQDTAEATADKSARMKAWCDLAVSAIGTVKGKAQGTLTIKAQPPVCQASISAKANCQAKCNANVKCDLKANPPTCTGGKLEVSCSGGCTAQAGATLSCEGGCDATCSGSCTADAGGVECNGKCEGTCSAKAGASGNGLDAQGNCTGICKGTCAVTAPNVKCTGSCKGTCSGTCKAQAGASVKCDGKCDVDAQPISCQGGKLEGGCSADAKCDGNCDASVSAKAECSPPSLEIVLEGSADASAAGKLVATLKANLGVVLAFKARLTAMADLTGTITGNASAVGSIKAACIPQVIAAGADAAAQVVAAGQATASVAGSVTIGGG
jgi:modification target Cys-rich repeat protein